MYLTAAYANRYSVFSAFTDVSRQTAEGVSAYTRWGRKVCPANAKAVFNGRKCLFFKENTMNTFDDRKSKWLNWHLFRYLHFPFLRPWHCFLICWLTDPPRIFPGLCTVILLDDFKKCTVSALSPFRNQLRSPMLLYSAAPVHCP